MRGYDFNHFNLDGQLVLFGMVGVFSIHRTFSSTSWRWWTDTSSFC